MIWHFKENGKDQKGKESELSWGLGKFWIGEDRVVSFKESEKKKKPRLL